MKVAASFDHRGVKLRDAVLGAIADAGHEPLDLGVDTDAVRVDYPDRARVVGEAILRGEAERGVLVCGSGVGAVGRRLQDRRHPGCDLPRFVLRASGGRARRHERPLPRLGDRRGVARPRARRPRSCGASSSARGAIWSDCKR